MTETQGKKDDDAKSESREGTSDTNWPPYHWIQTDVEGILKEFWEATYDEPDLEQYRRFIRMLRLHNEGCRDSEIARRLETNNVAKYLSGEKKCFATHLRLERDRLGPPRDGFKWLPLRLKPRGTPDKEWIQVPAAIREYGDIISVLEQLKPTEDSYSMMEQFGYKSADELIREKADLFGFYLGVLQGDASKPMKGMTQFPSMTMALTLSQDKSNSFRFGEFSTLCANASLGLAMHQIRDAPSSDGRYTDAACYRWISPASPLITWTFRACLGLKPGELTTYDPVRMDWLLNAPKSFRIHFLQGLCESDGWINAGQNAVCLVSSPNSKFYTTLFKDFGISCNVHKQTSIEVLNVKVEDASTLPIFNPRINSNYVTNLQILNSAEKVEPRRRLPDNIIQAIRDIYTETQNYNEVCLKLAETTGYKTSSQTVKKYVS